MHPEGTFPPSPAVPSDVRSLLPLLVLLPAALLADPSALRVLQSGDPGGPMSLHERGITGEGEIIAVLDTGVDPSTCHFAEADGSLPPANGGTTGGALEWSAVDLGRRKIVAYDFLYSCAEHPGAPGCDSPSDPMAYDDLGHGTIAAAMAAGDRPPYGTAEGGDGLAPGAKLVVQDTGLLPGPCSLPGLGCPASDLTRVLEQAHRQGARVHAHQWGDRMASYSGLARQIDAFVAANPDAVVVFNAGNAGEAGDRSVSSPGVAKNAIQVGGTRAFDFDDTVVWERSGRGPSAEGRIKPDLVAPSWVEGPWTDLRADTPDCVTFLTAGTSWSAPLVAGAAALVRQFYRQGFHRDGTAEPSAGLEPSAALVKATLIASARRVAFVERDGLRIPAAPVPSHEQGFGAPVLASILPSAADSPRRLRVRDHRDGLAGGAGLEEPLVVRAGLPLVAALVWTDPAGEGLVHDLDLELVAPDGGVHRGNAALTAGLADRANNVEKVEIATPAAGVWRLRVRAFRVTEGVSQPFALVVTGDLAETSRRRPLGAPRR
ncbi:MAG TPA: S8 family serine peptidase [Thermoanaerobaculia bacterium]|nr:S8 family serine peptidase [Thermoanaerobaculia bacterium]